MTISNKYLLEALSIIAEAHSRYPDSRNLAAVRARLLSQCGYDDKALQACENFLVRFGGDDELLQCALDLRQRAGLYDRLNEGDQQSISLCLIVKDEEACLARCLASAKPVVHELIVVDTGSSDRTEAIAGVFGAKLHRFPWNGSFSDARNYGIDQAKGSWILILDADEVLSPQDYDLMRLAVAGAVGQNVSFVVTTRNYTRQHPQGWVANDASYPREEQGEGWHPSNKVRLFPNKRELRFSGAVHEMLDHAVQKAGHSFLAAPFVVHHYGELQLRADIDLDKKRSYYELGKQKLQQQPNDLPAIGELAVQAAELGLFEEAIDLWDRFLGIAPDAPIACFNKGFALMNLGRYYEALEVSRRAVELEPEHKEAAYNYGTCELYVGDPGRALQIIRPVAERYPEYPLLRALLAILYLATDGSVAAQTLVQELLKSGYGINGYIQERVAVLKTLHRLDVADCIMRNRSGG